MVHGKPVSYYNNQRCIECKIDSTKKSLDGVNNFSTKNAVVLFTYEFMYALMQESGRTK